MLRRRPEYWASRPSSQIWSLPGACQVFHRHAGLDVPEHLHDDPRRFARDGPAGTRPRIGAEQPARPRLAPATAPPQSFRVAAGVRSGLEYGPGGQDQQVKDPHLCEPVTAPGELLPDRAHRRPVAVQVAFSDGSGGAEAGAGMWGTWTQTVSVAARGRRTGGTWPHVTVTARPPAAGRWFQADQRQETPWALPPSRSRPRSRSPTRYGTWCRRPAAGCMNPRARGP
jgi:hypothetical protein